MDGRMAFIALLAAFLYLLWVSKPTQRFFVCALFVLGIAWVAFHAVSIYDLNNYYAGMDFRAHQPLAEYLSQNEGLEAFGAKFWFFITSKFGYKGFLPFFTVLAFYGMQLAGLLHTARMEDTPKKYMVLAAAFLLCTTKYYSVLAGVKNHLAFSIFAISLMGELLWGKKPYLCWAGYILSVLYHSSLLPFVLLRMLLLLYNRYSNWVIMGGLMSVSVIGYPLLNWIASVSGSEYLREAAMKTQAYFGEDALNALSLGNLSTAWIKILCIALLLLYASRLAQSRHWGKGWRSYLNYLFLAAIFTVGSAGSQHTLVRFPELLGLLAVPVLLKALPEGERQQQGAARDRSCIKKRPLQYPAVFFYMFLLDSLMFLSFQYLGTLTLIGWQMPAIPIY